MKIARLAGFVVAAVMVLSLAVASTAFGKPEFSAASVGATIKAASGTSLFKAGGEEITCTSDESGGTIASVTLLSSIVLVFHGCKAKNSNGEECTINTTNTSTAGLIITNTLHGELGLILPSQAVGLLLLPVASKKWYTLASTKCSVETAVSGNLAGLWSPIGKPQTTGKLVLEASSTGVGESIKNIDLTTGGLVIPEFNVFAKEGSVETIETLTYSKSVEVS